MSNALCLVCQAVSRGLHYGVNCCRACSAFFRRTNQLQLEYKCRFNRNCDLSQKNRYTCRHCRYNKCIAIGMGDGPPDRISELPRNVEMSVCSAFGKNPHEVNPRSNLIEPHGYSREREEEACPVLTKETLRAANIAMKTRIEAIFVEDGCVQTLPCGIPLTICQQAVLAFSTHKAKWPRIGPEEVAAQSSTLDVLKIARGCVFERENTAKFCMSIQPFAELSLDQKWVVFRNFWPRFMEMCRVQLTCNILGYDTDDDRRVHFDGSIVTMRSQKVIRLNIMTALDAEAAINFMRGSHEILHNWFTIPFKQCLPDDFEIMYLAMSMMWNLKNVQGISQNTLTKAEITKQRLAEELYHYYAFELNKPNFADRIYKLSHLLTAMEIHYERRKEDGHMSRTFSVKSSKKTFCKHRHCI